MEELKDGARYLIKNEKGKYEEIEVVEETLDKKFIKIGYESGSKIWYTREEIPAKFHIITQIK